MTGITTSRPSIEATSTETLQERARKVAEVREQITTSLRRVVVGLDAVIDQLLVALLADGHALLVGVPGLAKTLLVRSTCSLLDLEYRRIQFTPDLMPSDITGTEVIVQGDDGQREFSFLKGPLFGNLVLADEINRTPPKTQAALMEAMEELQVTSGGVRYPLEKPFIVLATQNPIEQEGTYPLPAAQLDRFLLSIGLDYPDFEVEARIARMTTSTTAETLSPLLDKTDLTTYQRWVRETPVDDDVASYALALTRMTRPGNPAAPPFVREWVAWGVGPRGAQGLVLGAKARALLHGRSRPAREDVEALVAPVFRHRLVPNYQAEADDITADALVEKLLDKVRGKETERRQGGFLATLRSFVSRG